jgi:hypothetical protein
VLLERQSNISTNAKWIKKTKNFSKCSTRWLKMVELKEDMAL